MNSRCHLLSLSTYIPDTVLTNNDIALKVDTSDDWIVTRTGIHQRHILDDTCNASDLGVMAARKALAEAGAAAEELTHVLVATCTPDALSPSVACIISGELGAKNTMSFDISAACSGFLYGISLCQAFLAQEPTAKILFICTEALTRRLDWSDRSTCILFGDAAAACIVSAKCNKKMFSVEDVLCMSDGTQSGLITVGGGTRCQYKKGDTIENDFFIAMNGRETYKYAVRNMSQVCAQILSRNSLTGSNVDLFIPHQANLRIIEAVGARLGLTNDRVFINVDKYGNTSSASIPLALAEAHAAGRISHGDRVLITAFGAGLTWGAALLHFD